MLVVSNGMQCSNLIRCHVRDSIQYIAMIGYHAGQQGRGNGLARQMYFKRLSVEDYAGTCLSFVMPSSSVSTALPAPKHIF